MQVPYYIARRYLFAKKSRNIINLISGISMFVVAAVAAAMLTVLSAVNGIDDLVRKLFNSFDAPVRVLPAQGKVFHCDSVKINEIAQWPEVTAVCKVLEDDVIVGFEERKSVATLRGVSEEIRTIAPVDSIMLAGAFILEEGGFPYAVVGLGIRSELLIPFFNDERPPLQVFAPIRGKKLNQYRENAFNRDNILISGVYSVNAELDVKYTIVPYSFAVTLFDRELGEVSALELGLKEDVDLAEFDKKLQLFLGERYNIETREEKNALIYKTNRSEKWAAYSIMLFILIIAAFNIMASLTMLVIEKRKDIYILRSMGLRRRMFEKYSF
jgi:lipoprotein-releasing system permease protein